jgi:RNA polymerase primary sigma factor
MANKKKTKKRPAKSKSKSKAKSSASKKVKAMKKVKRPKLAKRKPAAKRAAKRTAKKPAGTRRGRADAAPFSVDRPQPISGEQSGDLQGLSNVESADSESVDELLEEGNAFEADAVKGVEDAGDFEEREVHTHEVPEDDVPEEYLDEE